MALDVGEDAGARTWVCRGTPGADGLRVESVDPLAELPGGQIERAAAYRVLLAKVLEAPRSAWGFDFPFGIARRERPATAAPHLAAPWRDGWLQDLRTLAGGDLSGSPPARRTELELHIDAAGWERRRIAVGGLLQPLTSQVSVAILPFDALAVAPPGTPPAMLARMPSIHVFEADPGAMLRVLGVAGQDATAVLRSLTEANVVRPMARALRQRIIGSTGGRGLDAVLVAVAAWRASRRPDHAVLTRDPQYGREGYVYC